ncbi:MAG: type II toxin-antitoxin system RelE/ParE family toxin [Methylocystis sp.]|uniref:addiction module toxin RelE n=1 Tax=Methylocystis sp. TaxID=1911079 RepID=UPI00392F91FF
MGHIRRVKKPLHTVAETQIYLSRAEGLMSESERSAIVDLLAASPDVGDLIPGTGGLRKVRVPLAGRGKRGGAQVIYYFHDQTLPIYLLLAYAKNERDDLSSEQKAVLLRLVEIIRPRKRT